MSAATPWLLRQSNNFDKIFVFPLENHTKKVYNSRRKDKIRIIRDENEATLLIYWSIRRMQFSAAKSLQ